MYTYDYLLPLNIRMLTMNCINTLHQHPPITVVTDTRFLPDTELS